MPFNLLTFLVTILFFTIGFIQLIYSFKLKKLFPKKHNLVTSIATFCLYITAGIIYPIIYPSNDLIIQSLSTIIIVFVTPLIIMSVLFFEFFKTNNNKDLRSERDFSNFLRVFFINHERMSVVNWDFKRKLLHFIPGIIIILFSVYNLSNLALLLTIGYSGVLFFASLDLVRFSFVFTGKNLYYLLPKKVSSILSKFMKERELYEPLKAVPLILGMIPSLFFPLSIFISIALISTFSDGFASIIGHAFGRINFPKWSSKTLAGYAGGIFSAFIIVFFSCIIISPSWPITNIIVLSLAGTVTFFVIDLANSRIDDNILNPLITGIVLGVTYLIIFSGNL